jgi:hypothetical protein
MPERPKLPADDPMSEAAEEKRTKRYLDEAKAGKPSAIEQAIAHVAGAKPPVD